MFRTLYATSIVEVTHQMISVGIWAIGPGSGVGQSAGAGSPFTNYIAGVAAYSFGVGVLVTLLLVGAFLILNLGLLSKREEDRTGARDPSDVGFLKNTNWPQQPYERTALPAEEEDYDLASNPPPGPREEGQGQEKAA